jgi:hypothetical protein
MTISDRPRVHRRALRRLGAALPLPGWLLLLLLNVATSWATIVTRTQWVSDSRLYLAWSYLYLGHSKASAYTLTKRLLENMDGVGPGCNFCWSGEPRLAWFGPTYGGTVGPRALYPLLSTPFVWLFGGWGMLVVPVIAFAGTVVVLVLFTSRLYGPRWAFAAGAVLILSTTVERWSLMAMTEAPAMFCTTAILLVLPLRRATRRRDLAWFLVLLELGLFTRQFCQVIPVAVAFCWLVVAVRDRRLRNPWLPFAASGVLVTAVTVWLQGKLAGLVFGGQFSIVRSFENAVHYDIGGRVRNAPLKIIRLIAVGDYSYLQWDVLVLVVLAVALVGVCWRFRSELSALAVGMFVATYALNFLIVLPTAFRYASPQYPYLLLAALALVADLAAGRRPSRSVETPPDQPPAAPPAEAPARAGRPAWGWLLVGLLWVYVLWVLVNRTPWPSPWYQALWSVVAGSAALVLTVVAADRLLGRAPAVLAGVLACACPVVAVTAVSAGRSATVLALGAAAVLLLPLDRADDQADQADPSLWPALGDGPADEGGPSLRPARWGGLAGRAGLPGGPGWWRYRVGLFAVVVVVALVLAPAGLGLAAGAVFGWLAVAVRDRQLGNPWLPFAAVGLVAGAADLAVAVLAPGWGSGPGWAGRHDLLRQVAADFRPMAPDRVLYAVLLLAAVAVVVCRRRPVVAVALGGFAAATAVQWAGGASGFADFLAVFPAVLLAAVTLLWTLLARWGPEPAPGGLVRLPPRSAPPDRSRTVPQPAAE